MKKFRQYYAAKDGGVTIETSIVITIVIFLTACVLEAGLAYWQWNSAQQAARHGARLAATSDPIALDLTTMTGLESGAEAGDPIPDYTLTCSGKTNSCNQGGFNQTVLGELVYGLDGDGVCGSTSPERRGICDIVSNIGPENIEISYNGSGLGRAGIPANPAPLITVTIKDLEFDFVFLNALLPDQFQQLPPVSVSVMSEDLRSGA